MQIKHSHLSFLASCADRVEQAFMPAFQVHGGEGFNPEVFNYSITKLSIYQISLGLATCTSAFCSSASAIVHCFLASSSLWPKALR